MKKTIALLVSTILVLSLLCGVLTVPALADVNFLDDDLEDVALNVSEKENGKYTTTAYGDFSDRYWWNYVDSFSNPETATLSNGNSSISVNIESAIIYYLESVKVSFSISASDWENAAPGEYSVTVKWSAEGYIYLGESFDKVGASDTIILTATKTGVIDEVSFSVEAPEAGQSAGGAADHYQESAVSAVSLDADQHCTVKRAAWGVKNGDSIEEFTGEFEAGGTYYLGVELDEDDYYEFDRDNGVAVSVSGDGTAQSDKLSLRSSLDQQEEDDDVDDDADEGVTGFVLVEVKIAEEESSEESSEDEETSEEETSEEESEEESSETDSEPEESSEEESSESSSKASKPSNPGKPDEVSMGGGTAGNNGGGKASPDTGSGFMPLAALGLMVMAGLAAVAFKRK